MKIPVYIAVLALAATSCSTARSLTMEDDIYYVPGQKALVVKEVEDLTGQNISVQDNAGNYSEETSRSAGSSIAPAAFSKSKQQVVNTRSGKLENVDIAAMTGEAQEMFDNYDVVNETIYENTGYWIGGFKGSENDLPEIQRIINMYPNGFAFFNSNGFDIAMNLSFDPDWNVYTDNGRYWWFPTISNINLYSSLLFGTYPKYIWTVVWDSPRFDTWAFNSSFNPRFNVGINVGWGSPGWSLGFGWNSGWYDPWYSPWYGGWYDPWYRPYYGYYPGWGHGHWGHGHWGHGHWNGGYYPNRPSNPLAGQRPNYGGGVSGIRPDRRPGGTISGVRPRPGSSSRPGTSSSVRP